MSFIQCRPAECLQKTEMLSLLLISKCWFSNTFSKLPQCITTHGPASRKPQIEGGKVLHRLLQDGPRTEELGTNTCVSQVFAVICFMQIHVLDISVTLKHHTVLLDISGISLPSCLASLSFLVFSKHSDSSLYPLI